MLRKIETEDDLKIFGNLKVELIKFHQQYANELGLFDRVVDRYNYNAAIKHVGKDRYFQFLIIDDDKVIGVLEYEITKSEIDKNDIIYIHNFYIKDEFRGMGIGKKVMNELKKLNYRIELECWYGMPANDLYRSMGMKEIKTRYMWDN